MTSIRSESEQDWDRCSAQYIEKFGSPENAEMPTEAELAQYRGILPDVVLMHWEYFGFSSFGKGRFQFVRPHDYKDVVDAWIKDTILEGRDTYHVLRVSAFGDISVWGEKTGGEVFDIAAIPHHIFFNGKDETKMNHRVGIERKADTHLFSNVIDAADNVGPMYPRARKAHGALKPNEIYGFVPALLLGGDWHAKNLQKVDGPSYLHMLAGLKKPPVIGMKELGGMAFGGNADAVHAHVTKELDK